ncbi:hypothetical protein MBT84_02160 [Streptomyces sp. MBT84]|nr:hypothetical protein [Streptomyces sp. MBT84]
MAAVGQVQQPVHQTEHGIDLVGHEDHRRAVGPPPGVDELGDGPLVVQVEGEQWFVADQDLWVAGQGLGDAHALSFAAGQQAEGDIGVRRRSHRLKDLVHLAAGGGRAQTRTETVTVDAEADEVTGS